MTDTPRDYEAICTAVRQAISPSADSVQRMRIVVDAIWNAMRTSGVSWVGFYVDHPGEPDDRRLALGPCRDKPACSPIGLHGMCGKALLAQETCIVQDVRSLGAAYIACDPRDQSEIVIPVNDIQGRCWAVLDVDSRDLASFDSNDDNGFRRVLESARLLLSQSSARHQ